MNRRHFVHQAGIWSLSLPYIPQLMPESLTKGKHPSDLSTSDDPMIAATDETYWQQIRLAYSVHPSIINLNNGGVSPQPFVVQEAMEMLNRECNQGPSYFMWRIADQGREPLRANLARFAGCNPEELAINRNSTEALDTIIFGLRLKAGDEVIHTLQDYPNMVNAWKMRELRDGLVIKRISLDVSTTDDDAIVKAYTDAMTSKTKVVHITHMINWNGQILPVRRIADAAHSRGIEVLVDGAHTFAHIDFKIPDLGADYFGTSLHKWLCAPFGSGLLYVKKEKIAKLFPMFPGDHPESDDIRKFENLGTRSFPIEQSIGNALIFHESIGTARKEARLRYLKEYWYEKTADIPGVEHHTPKGKHSCAIGGFSIKGQKVQETADALFAKYKIHTVGIDWENIHCVRVTPHVYTMLSELDKLVDAIRTLAK